MSGSRFEGLNDLIKSALNKDSGYCLFCAGGSKEAQASLLSGANYLSAAYSSVSALLAPLPFQNAPLSTKAPQT
jgi:hypothetical protein